MEFKFLVKNTKIVSTFGPSVTFDLSIKDDYSNAERRELLDKSKGIVRQLIKSGVNCVRFNFSHGLIDENSARISVINEVQKGFVSEQEYEARKYLRPVVFMADTKGPEIRVFDMGSNGVDYKIGQQLNIYCREKKQGSDEGFSVVDVSGSYNMANDCCVGNYVLVEDGKLTLEIIGVEKEKGIVRVVVKNSHKLKTNKRINLPGADYSMKFLSDKDKADICYALDNGFEYLALSFVNSGANVNEVRSFVADYCKSKGIPNLIKVYSKTETQKSCDNLSEIVRESDGVMIARGDLGLEIPYYKVPFWTKRMIGECRRQIKPVITATQMLDSLERNVVATRAEVSDVYRAAELGSDCTMLSGETAQGMFPVLSVVTMSNIVCESELHFDSQKYQRFFKEEVYADLSDEVKNDCDSLMVEVGKGYDAVILNYDDVSEEFIKVLSNIRFPLPIFLFVKCEDLNIYCSPADWGNKDYLKMKKAASLMLYRAVNPVFVSGECADLKVMFDEFVSRFNNCSGCDCVKYAKPLYWKCK